MYTNLLQQKCYTTSTIIKEYPIEIIEIFKDCVSLDLIQKPVIILNNPMAVYDKNSIIEWFSRSNVEPLTGVKVSSKLHITECYNFIIAMILLEYDKENNKLLFHKPNTDLINLQNIIREMHKSNNKKNIGGSEENIRYLDLDYYENLIENPYVNNFTEYMDYDLEDILLYDIFTGKYLTNPILHNDYFINKESLIKNGSYKMNTIKSFLFENDNDKAYNINIIIKKIEEQLKPKTNVIEKDINKTLNTVILSLNKYDKTKVTYIFDKSSSSINLRNGDFYLEAKKTYEYMYEQYIKIYEKLKDDDKFKKTKKLLSDEIKKEPNILNKPQYGYETYMLNIREKLNFPILTTSTPYADDFSFLDLDDMLFLNTDTKVDLKGREFIGTNFTNTEFINTSFSVCAFIGTKLLNAKFINCRFKECVFYKCNLINCEFTNCSADAETKKTIVEGLNKLR